MDIPQKLFHVKNCAALRYTMSRDIPQTLDHVINYVVSKRRLSLIKDTVINLGQLLGSSSKHLQETYKKILSRIHLLHCYLLQD